MMDGFLSDCCSFGTLGTFGVILTLLIIVGFVLLLLWLVRRITSRENGIFTLAENERTHTAARDILQTRYASGEITRDQYQQMLNDLS